MIFFIFDLCLSRPLCLYMCKPSMIVFSNSEETVCNIFPKENASEFNISSSVTPSKKPSMSKTLIVKIKLLHGILSLCIKIQICFQISLALRKDWKVNQNSTLKVRYRTRFCYYVWFQCQNSFFAGLWGTLVDDKQKNKQTNRKRSKFESFRNHFMRKGACTLTNFYKWIYKEFYSKWNSMFLYNFTDAYSKRKRKKNIRRI